MSIQYHQYLESAKLEDQEKGIEVIEKLLKENSINHQQFFREIKPFLGSPATLVRGPLVNLLFQYKVAPAYSSLSGLINEFTLEEKNFVKDSLVFLGWFEEYLKNFNKDELTEEFQEVLKLCYPLLCPEIATMIIQFLKRGFERVKVEVLSVLINMPSLDGLNYVFDYCNKYDDDSTRQILSSFKQFNSMESMRSMFYYYDLLKERMIARVEDVFKQFEENLSYRFLSEVYRTDDEFLIRKGETLLKHLSLARMDELKKENPISGANTKFILVVDDQVYLRSSVSYILKKKGFKVECANNGKEAVAFVNSKLPELVLMDVMMPVMNGFEATEQLKKTPRSSKVPVIMLTAKGTGEDVKKAVVSGAVDYIAKPYTIPTILAKVCRVLYKNHPITTGIEEK